MQPITKLLTVMALVCASVTAAAQTVTINFDNQGDESGVTTAGTSEFDFMGSSWTGGVIRTQGIPALYASGAFSYEVPEGPATVVFDQPASGIEFFFVHGGSVGEGTATAFDANGVALASASSSAGTQFGDPDNFVSFDTEEPIMAVEFDGGIVDNFTYTLSDAFSADFRLFDGNWVNADDAFIGSSQGFAFDYLQDFQLLFVAWFTYTTMPEMPSDEMPMDVGAPGNRWLTAQLEVAGNTASGDLFATRGGEFEAPRTDFQETVPVGTMTVEFTACNRATVSYSIDEPSLAREFEVMPLVERIGGTEPKCEEENMGAGESGG